MPYTRFALFFSLWAMKLDKKIIKKKTDRMPMKTTVLGFTLFY